MALLCSAVRHCAALRSTGEMYRCSTDSDRCGMHKLHSSEAFECACFFFNSMRHSPRYRPARRTPFWSFGRVGYKIIKGPTKEGVKHIVMTCRAIRKAGLCLDHNLIFVHVSYVTRDYFSGQAFVLSFPSQCWRAGAYRILVLSMSETGRVSIMWFHQCLT